MRIPDAADPGTLAAEAETSVLAEAVDRIAHQLKNPLQAMTVNLEVIRMRAEQGDREETERLTDVVDQNIRRVDRRIRMLIALARRSPEEPLTSIDLGSLLPEADAAFRLGDREDGFGLQLRIAGDEGDRGAGEELPVRGREGGLLALLLSAASCAARAADGEETPYLAAGRGESGAWIELGPGAPWRSDVERRELLEQARLAGGEVEEDAAAGDGPTSVRIVFPGP